MSNLETAPAETVGGAVGGAAAVGAPVSELMAGRDVVLGGTRGMRVTRTLPNRGRRMVGAWCFLDHFGPADITGERGMLVPPHPHTGLQTVTWLVEGEILHRDTVGSTQAIHPGQLNLMTAGAAIAHAETSPPGRPPVLHGVQLWVALPDGSRRVAPHFAHHADLPVATEAGVTLTVLMGELAGLRSPAETYTPLVGAELAFAAGGGSRRVPLDPRFEYAAEVLDGIVAVDGTPLTPGALLYLGCARTELAFTATGPARLLLLGGEPFDEHIVMWWNFVGRTHEEIVGFREEWMAGRYPDVVGYDGDPLPAPALPTTPLVPRGRQR